jgi:hypothetical protein
VAEDVEMMVWHSKHLDESTYLHPALGIQKNTICTPTCARLANAQTIRATQVLEQKVKQATPEQTPKSNKQCASALACLLYVTSRWPVKATRPPKARNVTHIPFQIYQTAE